MRRKGNARRVWSPKGADLGMEFGTPMIEESFPELVTSRDWFSICGTMAIFGLLALWAMLPQIMQ